MSKQYPDVIYVNKEVQGQEPIIPQWSRTPERGGEPYVNRAWLLNEIEDMATATDTIPMQHTLNRVLRLLHEVTG